MSESGWIDCGEGVRLERAVRARMRDGVELVSDHYYPREAGPQPTLLMRQPYGRDIASTVVYAHPVWFARHGYNVVIQDVRGRGDSDGEFYPFRSEGPDGADTIAWVRTRPECNGRVGMYGFSYQGMTQLLAAAEQPEGLLCISPGMTAANLYHGWFYQGGVLRLASTLGWGLQLVKVDARKKKLREASERLEEAWANLALQTSVLPLPSHPALNRAGLPSYVLDWLDHDLPGVYWSSLDVCERLGKIRVPALHVSGWYDMFLRGSVDGFLALSKCAGSELARENQYLLAGPWVHIPWGDRIGAADFGPEALIDTDTILLRWFDHWLKDAGTFDEEPRVCHFALGENRWREADDFPSAAEAGYALFLHSGGRANSRKGDGTLSMTSAEADEPCDIFICDPEVPVMAPGGPTALAGQFDQAALELEQILLVLFDRAARKAAVGVRHSARGAVLLHFASARRLHRKARAREARWRGGIYLHRRRAIQLSFCRQRIRRGQDSPLGVSSGAYFLPLCQGRAHSPGNRRQRVPALRSQPRKPRAFRAGDFLGLAALDAVRVPRKRAPIGALFAGLRGARMSAGASVPEIEIAGLAKQYGNAPAVLRSIDLVVAKKEFVTLLGPSGCGKSTILKLIAGLTPPTSGTIRVDGMTPQDARETMSFVFQDATLLPWRTVTGNIGLGLELERAPRDQRERKLQPCWNS